MDEFLESYVAKNGSKSSSTKTTLKTSIKRLEKIIRLPFEEWTKSTFKNYNEIVNILIEDYSVNTIILTILAIIRFLEYKEADEKEIDNYKGVLNDLVQERKKTEHSQEITAEEKANWITYPQLKKRVEKLGENYLKPIGKKAFSKMRNFVILALYSLQPPTRIGNYLDMKIRNNCKRDIKSLNKKHNYICKQPDGKYKMVFNKYKTSKYLGKIVHVIENEMLNKLLDKYITQYVKGDVLFTNANGKPITQPNFTQAQQSVSKNLLGKTLTTNDFRHIFLSWFQSQNPSIEEKEKIATLIGQTYKPSRMELYAKKDGDEMVV